MRANLIGAWQHVFIAAHTSSMPTIRDLVDHVCFKMTEGSSSTAPFASSAEDMTPVSGVSFIVPSVLTQQHQQERLGVVNWLTESPASCWSDSSKVLERAIPRIRDETKKRGRQTPQSSGQDSSGLPDPTIGPPGDEEQESDDEADIPSGKRPKTGRKEGGSAPGPSASSRSSGSSDTPSTRASPSPTPPASKTPAGAVANLNGRPKRDDDALLPDVHDIPVVHQEIVREFSTMSAHLAQSTRSRLNALVVSLARATTWRDDHWRSIWEPDRSTVVTPTGTSTSNATPAPASASNAASAPASSSSIEKLARLFNTIVKRTQYDEAVERLYLVLLRCEIVWDAGKTHSPDEGAASGLADKIGCKRLVTEHRRRAARYTQMANVLGNGVLLSLGEGPRR